MRHTLPVVFCSLAMIVSPDRTIGQEEDRISEFPHLRVTQQSPNELIVEVSNSNPLVVLAYICGYSRFQPSFSDPALVALQKCKPVRGLLVGRTGMDLIRRYVSFINESQRSAGESLVTVEFLGEEDRLEMRDNKIEVVEGNAETISRVYFKVEGQ